MNPSHVVAVASVVVILALESEGNTKKMLGESCAQGEDCVPGSNCTDSKICNCESGSALNDKSGCVDNVEKKGTSKECMNNGECELVLGTGPCIATAFDGSGIPNDNNAGICACAPNNRLAANKASCLIACDNDGECMTSEIQAALRAMKNNGNDTESSSNSTGPRQTCVVSKADNSFKYCDFGFKSNRISRERSDSVDVEGSKDLNMWLLITIILSSLAIIATVVLVVVIAIGYFSGEPDATIGRARGIPVVRKTLKLAPLPYAPMYRRPSFVARRPSAPPVRRVSSASLRGRRPSQTSTGRRVSVGSARGRRPSVSSSRQSVSSRRASSTVDSVASSAAESSFSVPESSTMVSDAESSVYSDYSQRK